jgi:quinol monooxygenase YgiN
MRDQISWVVTCSVKPGKFEEFKKVVRALVEDTRKEPGNLAYDYNVNADETIVHIVEIYASSEAIVSHVTTVFALYADRFVDCVDVDSFVVYGSPNAAALEILDGFGSTYFTPFDGYLIK